MLRRTVDVDLLELLVGALRRTVDDDRLELLLELVVDFAAEELLGEDVFLREYVLLEEFLVVLS